MEIAVWFGGRHIKLWRSSKKRQFYVPRLCALNPLQSASAKCLGITSSFLRCPFRRHVKGVHCGFSRSRLRPSIIGAGCPGGVVSPPSSCPRFILQPLGVRRSGGWASKGRARHPPLPRPRLQGRILTKVGFLNGPTTWKATSGVGSSSAMACFHITGKYMQTQLFSQYDSVIITAG